MKRFRFISLSIAIILICNFHSVFALSPPIYKTVDNVDELLEWIQNADIENCNFEEAKYLSWEEKYMGYENYINGLTSLKAKGNLLVPYYTENPLENITVFPDDYMFDSLTRFQFVFRRPWYVSIQIVEVDPRYVHLIDEKGIVDYFVAKYGFSTDLLVNDTTIEGSNGQEVVSYFILRYPSSSSAFFIKDGFEVSIREDRSAFYIGNINNLNLNLIPLTSHSLEWENPFVDVDSSDWFYSAVESVVTNGLFSGVSENIINPHGTMTRAMFTRVLANLDGVDLLEYTTSRFVDVPASVWYAPAVEWAASVGLVSGVGNNRFAPNDNVTREKMAVMLYNYIRFKDILLPVNNAAAFADEHDVSSWAVEAVRVIQAAGIISGKPGNIFDPKALATRAEAATIFARFLKIITK